MIRYEVFLKLTKDEYDILLKSINDSHYFLASYDVTFESGVSQDLYDKVVSCTKLDTIKLD